MSGNNCNTCQTDRDKCLDCARSHRGTGDAILSGLQDLYTRIDQDIYREAQEVKQEMMRGKEE